MPSSIKILVAEKSSFSVRGLETLSQIGSLDALDLNQAKLLQTARNYTVLVVRLGLLVNEDVLRASPGLMVIGTPTTGIDHIDLETAETLGIAVLSLKGERAFLDHVYATAEHTIALLLCLIRRIPAAFESVKNHEWRRDIYRGNELNGKTLGIVGCGRLGSMVARYGLAFGMRVIVYDPYQTVFPSGVEISASLLDLLEICDGVSIHVPLNRETQSMFSTKEFACMRPGAWLVNTARGAVIDEAALLNALESGRLAGAALDVICDEADIDSSKPHPLIAYARGHDNLIITPHIGGATYESVEKADLFIANKITNYLKTRGVL
jgi:D-3-phosphoglycerate dehydrogenase